MGQDHSGRKELPPDLLARVRLSWERCLDPAVMEASDFFTKGLYQATFEDLCLSDVTKMARLRRRLKTEPVPRPGPSIQG